MAHFVRSRRIVSGRFHVVGTIEMTARKMDVKSIFDEALEIESLEERQEWLDRVCANDLELKRTVEALLKAHDDAGDFLE